MFSVRYGGKNGRKFAYAVSSDMVAVRTEELPSVESSLRTRSGLRAFRSMLPIAHFPEAGVSVLRVPEARAAATRRNSALAALKNEPKLRFTGRVLADPASDRPILYTENLFVKFAGQVANRACKQLLKQYALAIKSEWEYSPNTFFVAAEEGTGLDVFKLADKLLDEGAVELCHPELLRQKRHRTAFPQQWHLKPATINGKTIKAHANVVAAWPTSTGQGITIALIDDGVDIDHEEFSSAGKIKLPRDVGLKTNDPRPKQNAIPFLNIEGDSHGTACAGVACAGGLHGASGVAPNATLMPIRNSTALGSMAEHDAFIWAADHGADVISCSWGPEDGDWSDRNDPVHNQVVPLPDSTRQAIEHAISSGRGGKGCVITFAAGNGNESVDNDGYASFEKVIAVAACNDRSRRSVYSDFGKAVWCSFPSNDFGPPTPRTTGIWTTDRTAQGEGYNPSFSGGDAAGKYTDGFGGTSSAAPGVAGVAALMLAKNPLLKWDEVRDRIKQSCDRIDETKGKYDTTTKRSPLYGFGRVNAKKAVDHA